MFFIIIWEVAVLLKKITNKIIENLSGKLINEVN